MMAQVSFFKRVVGGEEERLCDGGGRWGGGMGGRVEREATGDE